MFKDDPDFYREILFHIHDGVYFVDRNRTILYWNGGAARLTGYSQEEIIGRRCNDNILNHVDSNGCGLCENGCPLSATIADGQARQAQVFLRHKLGHRVPVTIRVQPLRGKDGTIEGAVEIFSDNATQADSTRKIEELRRLAFLDHLTQLPNRRFLEMTLQTAFSEYQIHRSPFAVMIIDLDAFKAINDTFGHPSGDKLLFAVGQSLVRSLRATDLVGRWGGDEFLAIVRNVDEKTLRRLANRCVAISATVGVPETPDSRALTSVSVGATLIRTEDDLQELVLRADRLVYASKVAGRNGASVE